MRYIVILLMGAALGAGSLAVASPNRGSTNATLSTRVWKLERAVGNICVFFKHPPHVSDISLRKWFTDVGLGCPTYGLH